MVDVPSKVSKTYSLLISLYNACLETMIPGNEIKDVLETAKSFLKKKDADLLNHLPKTLGFAIGLEFRDGSMVLNGINNTKFTAGMVFNLSVGFHNVPLSEEDKASSPNTIKKLSAFSLLLADIVVVQKEGVPDVLTKLSKEFNDVSYTIKDENVC